MGRTARWFGAAAVAALGTGVLAAPALAYGERSKTEAGKGGQRWFNLGHAGLQLDEAGKAKDRFLKALELGHRPGATTYNVACSYARMGDGDRALEWLGKAREAGFEWAGHVRHDRDLDSLRGDPRFQDLLREARKQQHAGHGWRRWLDQWMEHEDADSEPGEDEGAEREY